MAKNRITAEAIIPAAGTTSATVAVPQNSSLVGVITPATFAGTALTFKAGYDAAVAPVGMKKTDGSADYSIGTVTTSKFYPVNANDFAGISYLQVISNATETPGATLILVFAQMG